MLLDGLSVKKNILIPRIIRGNIDREAEEYAGRLMELFGISDDVPVHLSDLCHGGVRA